MPETLSPQAAGATKLLFVDAQKGLGGEFQQSVETIGGESLQLEIISVPGVKEAIEKLGSDTFTFILLELVLPTLSGYHLLELLSKSERKPAVIIYTKLSGEKDLSLIPTFHIDNLFLKDITSVSELAQFIVSGQYKVDLKDRIKELLHQIRQLKEEEKESVKRFTQCPACQLILSPTARFCNNCGKKIEAKNEPLFEEEDHQEVALSSHEIVNDMLEVDRPPLKENEPKVEMATKDLSDDQRAQ